MNTPRIIPVASIFRSVYSAYIDRYTYEHLTAIMDDVMLMIIEPIVGCYADVLIENDRQQAYADVKAQLDADGCPLESIYTDITGNNSEQKELLRLIRKTVASIAVAEGMRRHYVKMKGGRVVYDDESTSDQDTMSVQPKAEELGIVDHANTLSAQRYIHQIETYIEKNMDELPGIEDCLPEPTPEEEESCPARGCSDETSGVAFTL